MALSLSDGLYICSAILTNEYHFLHCSENVYFVFPRSAVMCSQCSLISSIFVS